MAVGRWGFVIIGLCGSREVKQWNSRIVWK
jgi:hypothetical protein